MRIKPHYVLALFFFGVAALVVLDGQRDADKRAVPGFQVAAASAVKKARAEHIIAKACREALAADTVAGIIAAFAVCDD